MKDWVAGSGDAEDGYKELRNRKTPTATVWHCQESESHGGQPGIRELLEANPDLRRAWNNARVYREAFATPEEARQATALIGDLNRMDALFFSSRPKEPSGAGTVYSALQCIYLSGRANELPRAGSSGRRRPAPAEAANASNEQDGRAERTSIRQNQGQSSSPIGGILRPRQNSFRQRTQQYKA